MLPIGQPPIVQFNDEIGWRVENPKLASGKMIADIGIGEPVHIFDVLSIDKVLPPTVNDKPVASMFLYWGGFEYHLFTDDQNFEYGSKFIANYLQNWLIERVVKWAKINQEKLQAIGLWTVTSLLPYPLSKIVNFIDEGNSSEARKVLIDYCNSEFISTRLVQTWRPIKAFKERHQVFDDALFSHKAQRYHASINTLISHVEGVIVDWLHEIIPATDVKWRTKSRIEQFRSILNAIPQFQYAYRQAMESTLEFLHEGDEAAKPFQKFGNWLDKIDPNFPSRHAIDHGKYFPEIYTEENSIKLFLLLDTICQYMMFYEVRVLERDIGQNNHNEASTDL